MNYTTVKQKITSNDDQLFQMFISGSAISAVVETSFGIKDYSAPTTTSSGIKFYRLQKIIKGLSTLPTGWDSYGADAISPVAIATGLDVLTQLSKNDFFSTGIDINAFPMRNGGMQFEFDANNFSAELEINAEGEMRFVDFDEEGGIVSEKNIYHNDLSELSTLLEESSCAE